MQHTSTATVTAFQRADGLTAISIQLYFISMSKDRQMNLE